MPDGEAVASGNARRWGFIEVFVLIQFLSGILLFLPGAQSVRMFIRTVPYVSSLAGLVLCLKPSSPLSSAPGAVFLLLALGLFFLNMLHPTTVLSAGFAQCVFQVAIAAPLFWVSQTVRSEAHLERLLRLAFLANAASAFVGTLQVVAPAQFMPSEFSALALGLNPDFVDALTYTGRQGQNIVRPPGLSDLPGGGAIAGIVTAVLGIGLSVQSGRSIRARLLYLALAGTGILTVFFTHVRSLFLMMLVALLALAVLTVRRKPTAAAVVSTASVGLVAGMFALATAIGGEAVSERFLGLAQDGVFTTYRETRGHFVESTFTDLLEEFPLGAGLGRWGMMQVYFGDPTSSNAPPLHVEIQPTGWLFDGGVLMWLFYGGAVLAAARHAWRLASSRPYGLLAALAGLVFALELVIIGQSFAGPVFNTALGVQFWMLAGALYGAAEGQRTALPPG